MKAKHAMSMYGMGGGMGGMDPTMMMGSVCCIFLVSAAVLLFVMQSQKSAQAAATAAQLQNQARLAAAAAASASAEPDVPIGGPVSSGDADWDIAVNGEDDSNGATDVPDSTKAGKKGKKVKKETAKKSEKKAEKNKNKNKNAKGKKTRKKKTKTPVPTPPGASTLNHLNATTIRQTWSDGTVRDWNVRQ